MITFKQFVTEDAASVSPAEAAKYVAKNCQQFLKETNFHISHSFVHFVHAKIVSPSLYRGMQHLSRTNGYILSGQRSRNPVDSSKEITDTLDTYFKQHFGYPYRQGVFCCGDRRAASHYGDVFMIFPTDGYNSIWSDDILDAYTSLDQKKDVDFPLLAQRVCLNMEVENPFTQDIPIEDAWEKWYVIVYSWLQEFHPYVDGNIVGGIKSPSIPEIMLRCKSYVAIPIENAYHSEFVEAMLEITKDA